MHGMIGFIWTDQKRERARLLWAGGDSALTIARELGCSRNAIIGLVQRKGWKSPHSKPQGKISPEKAKLIIDMHREGWSNINISIELACNKSTVRKYLAAEGLRSHQARERKRISVLTGHPVIGRARNQNRGMAMRFAASLRANGGPVCESDPVKRSEISRKAFGEPCGLVDATGCRWSVSDDKPHLFCNAEKVPGLPYCKHHAALAYNPGAA